MIQLLEVLAKKILLSGQLPDLGVQLSDLNFSDLLVSHPLLEEILVMPSVAWHFPCVIILG